MVSNLAMIIFSGALVIIFVFGAWSVRSEQKRSLLHKLYLFLELTLASWIIPVMCLRLVNASNTNLMFLLDCAMQPGGALCTPIYLCIAVTFVEGHEKMKQWMKWIFIVPVITILVVWTNPLHHLYYEQFSVMRSEIVFGPYMLVNGAWNYVCL